VVEDSIKPQSKSGNCLERSCSKELTAWCLTWWKL